jgi:hypothetical protein
MNGVGQVTGLLLYQTLDILELPLLSDRRQDIADGDQNRVEIHTAALTVSTLRATGSS